MKTDSRGHQSLQFSSAILFLFFLRLFYDYFYNYSILLYQFIILSIKKNNNNPDLTISAKTHIGQPLLGIRVLDLSLINPSSCNRPAYD